MANIDVVIDRDMWVRASVEFDDIPWGVIDLGYRRTEFKLLRANLRESSTTFLVIT